jgi:Spy/CpxP family protein refolding chaperone
MLKKTLLAIFGLALASSAPLQATTRATDYPGSVTLLMEMPGVRSDLGLSSTQTAQIHSLRRELKSRSESLLKSPAAPNTGLTPDQRLFALIDGNNARALALLTPTQFARFSEIQNQILSYSMLVSPQIQKQLRLTYRQRASVEALRIRGLEFVAEINRSYGSGAVSHKNRVDILRDYRMRQAEEMKALLTPAQRNAFAALCGKPLPKS